MANKAKEVNMTDKAVEVANKARLARKAHSQASKFLRRGREVTATANERIAAASKLFGELPADVRESFKLTIGTIPTAIVLPAETAEQAAAAATPEVA